MSFLRHGQIYRSDEAPIRSHGLPAAPAIVSMSLRPAIPWRVGLHQSPPPLHRLISILDDVRMAVNHHFTGGGEFSTGEMGKFQPALTRVEPEA
jgi:hypothetical protein